MVVSIPDENLIPRIDLTGTLYTEDGADIFVTFVHPNKAGNALIAKGVTRYLIYNKATGLNVPQDQILFTRALRIYVPEQDSRESCWWIWSES